MIRSSATAIEVNGLHVILLLLVPILVELGGNSGPYDMPIYLTPGVEYGRVLGDVVRQVKDIWKMVTTT